MFLGCKAGLPVTASNIVMHDLFLGLHASDWPCLLYLLHFVLKLHDTCSRLCEVVSSEYVAVSRRVKAGESRLQENYGKICLVPGVYLPVSSGSSQSMYVLHALYKKQ